MCVHCNPAPGVTASSVVHAGLSGRSASPRSMTDRWSVVQADFRLAPILCARNLGKTTTPLDKGCVVVRR